MVRWEGRENTNGGIVEQLMDKATLTISLPRPMKEFITAKLREGRFSTPSEYIRSLIRDDQDLARAFPGRGDNKSRMTEAGRAGLRATRRPPP